MPEMTFEARWPDGRVESWYSPSLVVHDHLVAGHTYSVRDFTGRATLALAVASERVREKFGYACTSAAASAEQLTRSAAAYDPADHVTVTRMAPPLPAPSSSSSSSEVIA